MADENTKSSDILELANSKNSEKSSECLQTQDSPYGLDATIMCSPNVLSTPRLRPPFSLTSKINEVNNILNPSQLNGNTNLSKSTAAFMLNPSKLNPFSKISQNDDSKDNLKTDLQPKFLPLVQNGTTTSDNKCEMSDSKPLPSTSQSNFVFGQNIQERVASDKPNSETLNTFGENIQSRIVPDKSKSDINNANGTTDSVMLFTSAMKETPGVPSKPNCSKSLSESAREYEESRAIKRKYDEVEIKTGEEGETNVLQISCKLFAFDKSGGGTWQERGRGVLRLNDASRCEVNDHTQSRLVFRTAGSLRVVLNTTVWAEMTVQLASNKSIRFTAFDSKGEIKVFLLTGTPSDIKQLHRYLEIRVTKEIDYQKQKDGDIVSTEPEKKKFATNSGD